MQVCGYEVHPDELAAASRGTVRGLTQNCKKEDVDTLFC